MPRGCSLSDSEKRKIFLLHEKKLSNRAIAKELNRSHKLINTFIKNPSNYDKTKRTGRK